ncbi:hypothetical protein B296_00050296 [Ensete ventricosum]|uniref:Uncharacterized protein n=1 Tax=Ensete ventricosum TaxID=4639 RepID=A0A426X783_ENSVE|nr:hypothetical protein B296_00050296 [Ensete ventricosum]
MEHGAEAQSFPLTEVKDMNSRRARVGSCCSMVLHSDRVDSFCMVLKTKGASRHMHLISEMHLTEELRAVYHRGRILSASTKGSHGGDLIIQRYNRNDWRNTKVMKQVVERGEEATTSLEGLSYPKAKPRLERRWTRRSVIVPQRRIYRLRRKGHRCKATDSRAMVPQRRDFRGVIDLWLSWRESVGRKRGRGGGECRGKLQVPKQGGRAEAKELHKTGVNGLLIKIAENEGLRIDARVLDQGTK